MTSKDSLPPEDSSAGAEDTSAATPDSTAQDNLEATGADSEEFDDMDDPDPVDQLRDLVEYVARGLVDQPEDVQVDCVDEDRRLVLELSVAQTDLGKVIGKEGRTARALRTLVTATSARSNIRAVLDILE